MSIEDKDGKNSDIAFSGTTDELFDGWLSLTRELCKVLSSNAKQELSLETFLSTALEAVKKYDK
jgi:hypothetical protein